MSWPSELSRDRELAPHLPALEALLPEGSRCDGVLRHVPGRRVALLLTRGGQPHAIAKVFASPRARGGHRRLLRLHGALGGLVPAPLAVDPTGHVQLVGWQQGEVYDLVDDRTFLDHADGIGRALAALHRSDVLLDRAWTVAEELTQLSRRATTTSRRGIDATLGSGIAPLLADAPLVPSHRDCHPRQVVVGDGVRWIDLDDAALAPAALDVGNFAAHLRREAVVHGRATAVAAEARHRFLGGYAAAAGGLPDHTDWWERLALLRLVGLAETRHGRADHAAALDALVGPLPATVPA